MTRRALSTGRTGAIAPYLRHLRLPFQLTLAPLFLWGLFIAGGGADARVLVAFIGQHLFLYPGITAFNAVYDRDTGPVSFLRHPPPPPAGLMTLALLLQLVGAVLATLVGAGFLLIYVAIAALAAAYSHPAVRWKAHPWKSAAAVSLGQGGLGLLAGWVAGGAAVASAPLAMLGAAAATLATFGLYPLTQVFQVADDRARGDRTLAVALGPARALRMSAAALAAAVVAMSLLAAARLGSVAAMVTLGGGGVLVAAVRRFARDLAAGPMPGELMYRRATRLNLAGALGSLALVLLFAAFA